MVCTFPKHANAHLTFGNVACFRHWSPLHPSHPSGPRARQAADGLAEGAGSGPQHRGEGSGTLKSFPVQRSTLMKSLLLQFVLEEYTLSDILNDVSKDDLRCLHLR